MKVNPESFQVTKGGLHVAGNGKTAAGKAVEPTTQGGEKIQISEMSGQLQALESNVAAPGFDTQRVDHIKQAISEGRFAVNSEAVADKLLASVQELLARQK